MKNGKWKTKNVLKVLFVLCMLGGSLTAQETPPKPSAPKTVKIPAVREKTLANNLKSRGDSTPERAARHRSVTD